MRLSLQIHYAICGSFDLAYNGAGEPVAVGVISERQAIPARYLEQIFQRLRRAGLVRSKRGPGGGYSLARPADEINLRQIVEAVEGSIAEAMAMGPAPDERDRYRPDFLWPALSEGFEATLGAVSLESLCRRAAAQGLPRVLPDAPMYFI
jgi:Rrf2 family iron-sulfur cluster assembly transcriptional regulator